MTAQEQLTKYAHQYNNGKILSDAEFVGKMAPEGCVINRTPSSKIVARARREGKTIIVTETTETKTTSVVNGKVEFGKTETTAEVMRIEL